MNYIDLIHVCFYFRCVCEICLNMIMFSVCSGMIDNKKVFLLYVNFIIFYNVGLNLYLVLKDAFYVKLITSRQQ